MILLLVLLLFVVLVSGGSRPGVTDPFPPVPRP